jgi:hypothetical protein
MDVGMKHKYMILGTLHLLFAVDVPYVGVIMTAGWKLAGELHAVLCTTTYRDTIEMQP